MVNRKAGLPANTQIMAARRSNTNTAMFTQIIFISVDEASNERHIRLTVSVSPMECAFLFPVEDYQEAEYHASEMGKVGHSVGFACRFA